MKESWGWSERQGGPARSLDSSLVWARVVEELRGEYRVVGDTPEIPAVLPGKWRLGDRVIPAVGDWVGVELIENGTRGRIREILPRLTKLSRQAAGETVEEQVMAANIDRVFVLTSLNEDLNPRRLERFRAIVEESGAELTILFTKSDLSTDRTSARAVLETLGDSIDHDFLSTFDPESIARVRRRLNAGQTGALVGSSGVGKSTLLNRLLGTEAQRTLEIRADDDKGRHVTTSRRLFRLEDPAGESFLIDMPGVREIQLWRADSGVAETFGDLQELALKCRFTNCTHRAEPGCAVRSAVEAGTVPTERLEAYRKLLGELRGFKKPRNPPKLK